MPRDDDLTAYPRPNVAVDLALLTVLPPQGRVRGTLGVLVQERTVAPRGRALPGRFLRERQTVQQGVADLLRLELDLAPFSVLPGLVRIFDDPDRDERAWTISLAHAVSRPYAKVSGARGEFVPVDRNGDLVTGETLLFDHDTIVSEAATALRDRYELRPDPDHLLGHGVTLGELRNLHEAVLGEPLLRDTFNRRMGEHLRPTAETRTAGGRPATVYVRAADRDVTDSERRRLQLPRKRA
jgi:8-oxo-dGTP diphosphatase